MEMLLNGSRVKGATLEKLGKLGDTPELRGDGARRGLTGSLQLCRDWVWACGLDRHRYLL